MEYPNLAKVNAAGKVQLGRWLRFLKSPGMSMIVSGQDYTQEDLEATRIAEAAVLARIAERFDAQGGWSPEVSKAVGWDA